MCSICGCGDGELTIDGNRHAHGQPAGQAHRDAHDHAHDHAGEAADLDFGAGPSHAHAPGTSPARMVQIEQDILAKNDGYAARNRRRFVREKICALNLVSSPGAGKTTLLTKTIAELQVSVPFAVVEGDQQTSRDAERIRATGAPTVQINTGKGCHLDAHMVGHALDRLALPRGGLLMIENVGNLVCPSAFDLGEAHKVVILSVTEGEDKPLKYPDMFHAADLMILNKVDLLPYVNFDVEQCIAYARRVHPGIEVLQLSATRSDGVGAWYSWLGRAVRALREEEPADPETVSAQRQPRPPRNLGHRSAPRVR